MYFSAIGCKRFFESCERTSVRAIGLRSDCEQLRFEAFEISRVGLFGYLRYQLRQVFENKVSQVSEMAMKLLCFTPFGACLLYTSPSPRD